MKIIWLTTTHMGMEPIIESLKLLWLNVSSMNQEPVVRGLEALSNNKFHFEAYRYDEGKEAQFHYEGEVDHNIQRKVKEYQPEIIIYSGPAAGKCLPQIETLSSLRENAKTVGYILDGGCPEWHPVLEQYKEKNVFDLMVNQDGNPNWPKRDKDITTCGLIDSSYYQTAVPKTTRLLFAGGAGSPLRQNAIKTLVERCGLVIPERSEAWGTYQAYADHMLKAKMVVNFPETGSGKSFHVKYRVIEAGLAGCCLFERKNPITERYFRAGIDYIEYESIEDLMQRINGISDTEIRKVAQNLYEKVRLEHNAPETWNKILKAL